MNKKLEHVEKIAPATVKKPARPNETGTLSVESHVKIFDPNTKEIIVEKRA
jgi:hypothetical protein